MRYGDMYSAETLFFIKNEPNELKTYKWIYNFLRDEQNDNGGRKGTY